MNAILKQRELMETTASAPDKLDAFEEGINRLIDTYPDSWVAYTDRWDEETRSFSFVVHGVFATEKEAADAALRLSPQERGVQTLISTMKPKPGVRIGRAVV